MYVKRHEGDGEVRRKNWRRSVWAGQALADGSGTDSVAADGSCIDNGVTETAAGCGYHTPRTWVVLHLYSSIWRSHGPGSSSDMSRGPRCWPTGAFSMKFTSISQEGIRYVESE